MSSFEVVGVTCLGGSGNANVTSDLGEGSEIDIGALIGSEDTGISSVGASGSID